MFKNKSFRTSIILTFIFLATGFAFMHYGWAGYGWLLFILLPFVLGLTLGFLPNRNMTIAGLLICLFFFFIGIITLGLEGYICVIMVLPIVLPVIIVGALLTYWYKKKDASKKSAKLPVLILPLFIFILGVPIENYLVKEKKRVIEVASQIELPYSSGDVYDAIKSMDTLIGEKTFLMKIDLPVPQKCVLEKEEVGGLRTCYFSGGKIVEKITQLERGKVLKMDVISYQLTGRKWLGFKEAIYLFDSLAPNKCKMTRITTYTSELRPRLYWKPLEKLGIEQEHEYVFEALKNKLSSINNP